MAPPTCCQTDSPSMLHVGGFVHSHSQFDLQLRVLAAFRDDHPMEVGHLGPVRGRFQEHLRGRSLSLAR